MTLWAIARSPLFVGANLTELDDWTVALLTNKDIVAIDQQGHGQRQVSREGDLVTWMSELPNGIAGACVLQSWGEPCDCNEQAVRDLWSYKVQELQGARCVGGEGPGHG